MTVSANAAVIALVLATERRRRGRARGTPFGVGRVSDWRGEHEMLGDLGGAWREQI
jgi:hypothetical protein